ncbi:unnamed protein product [Penicillium bialowiezense]
MGRTSTGLQGHKRREPLIIQRPINILKWKERWQSDIADKTIGALSARRGSQGRSTAPYCESCRTVLFETVAQVHDDGDLTDGELTGDSDGDDDSDGDSDGGDGGGGGGDDELYILLLIVRGWGEQLRGKIEA